MKSEIQIDEIQAAMLEACWIKLPVLTLIFRWISREMEKKKTKLRDRKCTHGVDRVGATRAYRARKWNANAIMRRIRYVFVRSEEEARFARWKRYMCQDAESLYLFMTNNEQGLSSHHTIYMHFMLWLCALRKIRRSLFSFSLDVGTIPGPEKMCSEQRIAQETKTY